MDELRRGDRTEIVALMQRLLNAAGRQAHAFAIHALVDGIFGRHSETALKLFQHSRHLPQTGVCDARTWNALGLTTDIRYDQIQLMGQPSSTSCWATAAAMITGNLFPTVGTEHMTQDGGLNRHVEDVQAFAQGLYWTMPDHSPNLAELLSWLARRPLWIAGTGEHFAHAVVISGAFGDGSAARTLLRIHDPWPIGSGRIYYCSADDLHVLDNGGHPHALSLEFVLVPN